MELKKEIIGKNYNEILEKRGAQASLCGMNPEFAAQVFEHIHEESVRQQLEIVNQ